MFSFNSLDSDLSNMLDEILQYYNIEFGPPTNEVLNL